MFGQVTLVGNLGSDVEQRYTPSGVMVANFRMAVNKSWIDQDGNRQEKVTWWRVSCWRRTAENVAQYLKKGQRVLVIGEDVEARAYTNREGQAAASLEVTASIVKFLSTKDSDIEADHGIASATEAVQKVTGSEADIPF